MTDSAYRDPPTTLKALFTGKRVSLKVTVSEGAQAEPVHGTFRGMVEEMGHWWIILSDVKYDFSRTESPNACVRVDRIVLIGLDRSS